MSATAIKPNHGTPFEQFAKEFGRTPIVVPKPKPKPRPVAIVERCEHSVAEQRLNALENANRVRLARAELKRDIKAGRVAVVGLLLDPPACLVSASVYDLLVCVPRLGRVKVTDLLRGCGTSPSRPVGSLTARERADLIEKLGNR